MAGVLGSDLALTRAVGVPGAVPLEEAHSWGTLDLAVAPGPRVGVRAAGLDGLAAVSGRANLAQALILRLLTPLGSLAALGHATYGSRLAELVGRRNDAATRGLARLHVIEAIAAEVRVAELLALTVEPDPAQPDTVRIAFTVLPVTGPGEPAAEPLGLALELVP